MADFARLLISKVVAEKDLIPAMNAGVRASWFEDAEHSDVFRWILDFYSRYGYAPSRQAFSAEFPNYRLVKTEEPYQYYLDRFRRQRRRAIMADTVISTDEQLRADDIEGAHVQLSSGLLRLGQEVTVLSDTDTVTKRRDRFITYRENRGRGIVTGIPTGFPTLDLVTGGFREPNFIVLGGMQKQGKSFMLMKLAINAQLHGKRVLFLSFEMSDFEQLCRYDAIHCGVNAQHLLNGTTTGEEMKRVRAGLRSMRGLPSFIISADISSTTTTSGLAAKVEQHRPDIIFVDGIYLMDNEAGAEPFSTQAYTAISRSLKRLAQRVELPLVGTTQALPGKMKNGKVTMQSLGWTSAWAQDADLILGVERDENSPSMFRARVVAGRNVSPREIPVIIDFETSTIEELVIDNGDEEDEAD